jgi:hypothetical protein
MTVVVSEALDCVCDGCGTRGAGCVFMGIALRPPAGWFVYGKVALGDDAVGPVEQWLYCSEKCAAGIDEATQALASVAATS